MRYDEATAFQLEEQTYLDPRRDLTYVQGGSADRRAREGVSEGLKAAVVRLIALALVLFIAGTASIALTSGTVRQLSENAKLSSQIKSYDAQNSDLRIECSLLSRADRISLIATQNLGMVYANDARPLSID